MKRRTEDQVKRAFDVTSSALLLLLTLPLQLGAGLAIRLRMGSPVLFRHTRPGLGGKPFEMVKFRTMLNVDTARGLVDEDDRMTPLGRWLRSTSIDELPTLWNIIRGDMSVVGPRPLMMEYLPLYSPEQARRHDVRPGITGLAQVSGRNAVNWEDRFRLDVQYVDHHGFAGDLLIILNTFRSVARRDGISPEGEEIMPEFFGSDNHPEPS
jgi:lipopolysaccharide/colanic/teichoic acid biosynthesis glycosyltransferase